MKLDTACGILSLDEDDIMELIQSGNLAWAWDVGLGKHRADVRVLAKCVRGYYTRRLDCGLAAAPMAEIIGRILAREKKPFIAATRMYGLLQIKGALTYDLLAAGELQTVKGSSAPRPGRGGSASITKESVVSFLTHRRIV